MINMRLPIEKVSRVLLRNSRSKKCHVQSKRSVAVKSSTRTATARPHLEPLVVTCPFKSAQGDDIYIPTGGGGGIDRADYGAESTSQLFPKSSSARKNTISRTGSITGNNSTKSMLPFSKIPSPPGLPLIGTLIAFSRFGGGTMIHEWNLRHHNQYGPIYKENIGGSTTLFVSDPELFSDVGREEGQFPESLKQAPFKLYNELQPKHQNRGVFFMEGEEWWNTRRALNPVMLKRAHGASKQVMASLEDYLSDYFREWEVVSKANSGLLINAETEMYKLGFQGVANILFGRLYQRNWNRLNEDLNTFLRKAQMVFEENNKMLVVPAKLAHRLRLKLWRNFEDSLHHILMTCHNLTMLCIKDHDNMDPTNGCEEAGMMYRIASEASLPHQTLVDVAVGLMASMDPPAVTLLWLLNTLGQHPEVQEQIHKEVLEVCGTAEPTYSQLEDLRFVKMFIKETMRLYPTAPFLARIMPEDCTIGGYEVPKGQLVALSLYASHRNEKFFPDPLKFMPQRWERRSKSEWDNREMQGHCSHFAVRDPTAFRPFGTGKRSCLGKVMAETILQLFVARVVQKFQIRSDPVEPKMCTIMVPDRPLNIRLKIRNDEKQ